MSANGGTPQQLTSLESDDDEQHHHPHFLPDGSGITFSIGTWKTQWDDFIVCTLKFDNPKPTEIFRGGSGGLVLETGHLIYRREETLMAAPFDLSRMETTAPGVPVLEGVGSNRSNTSTRVAISSSGTLVYLPSTGGNRSERQQHNQRTCPERWRLRKLS